MDWEFLEDGETIKPISVGMVREDGAELYYEFLNAPWSDILKHPWLKANVVPHLSSGFNTAIVTVEGNDIVKSKLSILTKVHDFLEESFTLDGSLELWGWYSSYDHVCLSQLFGKMINLPEFCPMYTNDLKQEFHRLGGPAGPGQVGAVHNALEDAKHIKLKHEWLMRYERSLSARLSGFQVGNGNTQYNRY
jgi:hypothetical protein